MIDDVSNLRKKTFVTGEVYIDSHSGNTDPKPNAKPEILLSEETEKE